MPIETGPSLESMHNKFLSGLYETYPKPDGDNKKLRRGLLPHGRPPHYENNVHGGWNYHARNDRNESLYLFRKPDEKRMSPQELAVEDKLAKRNAESRKLAAEDAVRETTGWMRGEDMLARKEGWSCLRKKEPQ